MSSSGASRAGGAGGGTFIPRGALDRTRQACKPAQTYLTAAVTTTGQVAWSIAPVDGMPLSGQFRAFVGTEEVFVNAGAGTTSWTVQRAQNGTTAATYAIGQRILTEATFKIVTVGDSTCECSQNTEGNGWDARLCRAMALNLGVPNLNPNLEAGYFPIFRNNDANVGGGAANGRTDWSAVGGAWTLVPAGGVGDRGPFGWIVSASGGTNILKLTVPATAGDIRCIDVIYTDTLSGQFSTSIDGGVTWVNAPGSGGYSGQLMCRARVTNATPITTLQIRAANAANTAGTTRIVGARLYATAPTAGSTPGVELWNLGKDSDLLSGFARANASGDDFNQFDGSMGAIYPDLALVGPFTNDVLVGTWTGGASSPAATAFRNQLTTVVTRLKPYCDVVLLASHEQSARSTVDQATLRQSLHTVAIAQGVAYFDEYDALASQGIVGWAAADAAGLMNTTHDTLHFGPLGYQDMAARLARMLSSANA